MESSDPVVEAGVPHFLDDAEIRKERAGKISILLVSDIHLAYDKVKLLTNWHIAHRYKYYDFVFASGDFGLVCHDKGVTPEEETKSEADIQSVL